MSIARFSPELRRALMKACPRYFGLPPEEQEVFRSQLTDDDELAIERQLYLDLFGISISTLDEGREAHRNLSPADVNRFNEAVLPLQGIGEDCFWLNEFASRKSTWDFVTLYDYDLDDYEFQEESRAKESPDYVRQPYRGSLYAVWARLFIDDVFTYGTLFCTAGYLYSEIEQAGRDALDRLIPHDYVRGKNDGKPESGGFIMDFKIDAGGKEGEFEELRERLWAYERERFTDLLDIWDRRADGLAWVIDETTPDDPAATFIFSDKSALKTIRHRHFMADCRRIEAPFAILEAACDEERKRVTAFLQEQHADIEANFDPKIRKFRKRRKVIATAGFLDDLGSLHD